MCKHYSNCNHKYYAILNQERDIASDKNMAWINNERYLRLCHKSINIYNHNYWFVFLFAINIGTLKWLGWKMV